MFRRHKCKEQHPPSVLIFEQREGDAVTKSRIKTVQPPVDLAKFVEATPLAILVVVSTSLELLRLTPIFGARMALALPTYLAGMLWLDRKPTATRMAQWLGSASHDQLTRLVKEGEWKASAVTRAFIRLIQEAFGAGWLILDDTHLPRPRSKKVEGAYWDFDSAIKRNVMGYRLVVVLWTNGVWKIPVAFAFWHKKGARPQYRSKNEIARVLLRWVLHQGIRPDYLAFDAWYASRENIAWMVKDLGLEIVTRLKCNYRLNWEGRRLRADTIGRRVLSAARAYCFSSLGDRWARATAVQFGEVGEMTFVVVKDDLDGERGSLKYLLSSTPRLGAQDVVLEYKSRWAIEEWFEILKQHAGLGGYQGRKLVGAEHHVALAAVAGLVLDHVRLGTGMTAAEAKMALQRLLVVETAGGERRMAVLRPVSVRDAEELDAVKKELRPQLSRVAGVKLRPLDDLPHAA